MALIEAMHPSREKQCQQALAEIASMASFPRCLSLCPILFAVADQVALRRDATRLYINNEHGHAVYRITREDSDFWGQPRIRAELERT